MPLQVPGLAVSVEERLALPAMVGAAVFSGGALGIVAVGCVGTARVPSALVAGVRRRTCVCSSPTPSGELVSGAAEMLVQVLPFEERCHWYAYVLPIPVQAPGSELNVLPRCAAPPIDGAALFAGLDACTGAVGWLAAATVASGFEAVTSRRTVAPSSATCRV